MINVEVKINASKESSYPILIGEDLLNNPYDYIKQYTKANKFLVVTNDKVNSLCGEKFISSRSEILVLPDGEIYKNMEVLNKIIDKALEIKLERKDAIIALGGGVIGDMAGFAASIYQRGIDFIQVPTTLLAQVDSSVGGKVAVNHVLGKNMIGSFYQPKLVLADTNTLNTLDERQFKTGLAEVLKYAFIEKTCGCDTDYNLFDFLLSNKSEIMNKNHLVLKQLIRICCELKSNVVNQDEKEKGLRAILNFGHTYAHAIEKLTNYDKYTHGEAVSVGMYLIFELAKKMNSISDEYYNSSIALLNQYGLMSKVHEKFNPDEFYETMKSDKKVSDSSINFVMPSGNKEVIITSDVDKKLVLSGIL